MIDRNVEFPNRFRMTLVPGTDDIYEVVPAPGDVIAAGDTFSKVNMLPDSIPALLGLKMANPQVKDALNVLANIGNVHVWERVQDGVTDYLTSTDRNAYTEGTVDSTTITYLGQLGGGARIEVGSYVGTGTYGSSNPNSLTFGFVPKYVRIIGSFDRDGTKNIFNEGVQNWNYGVVMEKVPTEFTPSTGFGDTAMYSKKSSDGKTLYWYNVVNAYDQYNGSGYRYYVLAIA